MSGEWTGPDERMADAMHEAATDHLPHPMTSAAYPPFDGAAWCGWLDPHPPHLYAAHGGVDDDVQVYACSGEGAE